MDLLLAIKDYCKRLMELGYYPKEKAPSVGKLEKMADLCMAGKFRKLSRYIPHDADDAIKNELNALMDKIKEIVEKDKKDFKTLQ